MGREENNKEITEEYEQVGRTGKIPSQVSTAGGRWDLIGGVGLEAWEDECLKAEQ